MSITKDLIKDIKSSYGHCADPRIEGGQGCKRLVIRHRSGKTLYTFPNTNGVKFMPISKSLLVKVQEWINS